MANGIDFNLGLTPEEQAALDRFKASRNIGAQPAGAPAGAAGAAPNTGRIPGWRAPEFGTPRATVTGPIPPGVGNPFPPAAAPAPAQPGAASRAAGFLGEKAGAGRAFLNGSKLIKGGGLLAAGSALANQFDPNAEQRYATRFAVDAPTGDGSVGDWAKRVGLRAGGFASDLGNAMTFGAAGNFYRDKPEGFLQVNGSPAPAQAVPPTLVPQAQAGAAGAATPAPQSINVERQKNGVLSFSGTGNGQPTSGVQYTGAGAASLKGGSVNSISPENFVALDSQHSQALQAARSAAAARGDWAAVAASYGGDFGGGNSQQDQLASLPPIHSIGDVNRYNAIAGAQAAMGNVQQRQLSAQQAYEESRAKNAMDAAYKTADLKIKKQNADAATLTAQNRGSNVVLGTDTSGASVIIDKNKRTSTKPLEVPAFSTFLNDQRPKNPGLTDAELRVEYNRLYAQ